MISWEISINSYLFRFLFETDSTPEVKKTECFKFDLSQHELGRFFIFERERKERKREI